MIRDGKGAIGVVDVIATGRKMHSQSVTSAYMRKL